jgi:hypothetical protein
MRRITVPDSDKVVAVLLSAALTAFLYILVFGDAKIVKVYFDDHRTVLQWQNDKPVG